MRTFALLSLLALAGCAHVASTSGTFTQRPGVPLVLKLTRHLDTVVQGPDVEEDQTLIVELRRIAIGQRINIPSDDAAAAFQAERFGPTTRGETYRGLIVVRSVSKEQVVATLKLEIDARSSGGSYSQKVRFNDDYTFHREAPRD